MDADSVENKVINDAHNRKVARESSWIYGLFQDAELNCKEKQKIITTLIKEFREKEELNGQAN